MPEVSMVPGFIEECCQRNPLTLSLILFCDMPQSAPYARPAFASFSPSQNTNRLCHKVNVSAKTTWGHGTQNTTSTATHQDAMRMH